jgi:hypothetical protein
MQQQYNATQNSDESEGQYFVSKLTDKKKLSTVAQG